MNWTTKIRTTLVEPDVTKTQLDLHRSNVLEALTAGHELRTEAPADISSESVQGEVLVFRFLANLAASVVQGGLFDVPVSVSCARAKVRKEDCVTTKHEVVDLIAQLGWEAQERRVLLVTAGAVRVSLLPGALLKCVQVLLRLHVNRYLLDLSVMRYKRWEVSGGEKEILELANTLETLWAEVKANVLHEDLASGEIEREGVKRLSCARSERFPRKLLSNALVLTSICQIHRLETLWWLCLV